MSQRFIELAVRACRLVTPALPADGRDPARPTARRQVGNELTQFSFRLAFVIDLAYVGLGALSGAAIGRFALPPNDSPPSACSVTPSRGTGSRIPSSR